MVKYHFAKNEAGDIVDIDDVTKEYRSIHSFCCLGCGATMNARLGENNAHHFYHSDGSDCGYGESDLHRYAKKVLKNKFEHGPAFPVRLVQDISCGAKCVFGSNCHAKKLMEYDLKSFGYDTIEEEKEVEGGFIADLLISDSSCHNPDILLEIFVTHRIGGAKERSGMRIIEIPVRNDQDLRRYLDGPISEAQPGESSARAPKFYGFRRDSKKTTRLDNRRLPVATMLVDYSIECTEIEDNISCAGIDELYCKPDELIKVVFDGDTMYSYRKRLGNFVRMVSIDKGIPVRNCKICKNAVKHWTRDFNRPIYCSVSGRYGIDPYPLHWFGVECEHFALSHSKMEEFRKEYASDKYQVVMNWPKGRISFDLYRIAQLFVRQEGFVESDGVDNLHWYASKEGKVFFRAEVFEPGMYIPEQYVVVENNIARWAWPEEIPISIDAD